MQLEKIQQIVKCSIVPFWGWTEVSENQGHGEGTKVTLPCTSSGSVPGSQRLCWMQDRSRPSYITWKKLTPCRSLGSVTLWDPEPQGPPDISPHPRSPGKGERRKLPGQAVEMLSQVQADHCTWWRGKEWGISCNSSSQARGVQPSLECVT